MLDSFLITAFLRQARNPNLDHSFQWQFEHRRHFVAHVEPRFFMLDHLHGEWQSEMSLEVVAHRGQFDLLFFDQWRQS
jgi:hypothetical protein